MDVKKHITALGFIPKNGTSGIYHKIYSDHNNYVISIDFDKEHIEYGDKIIAESKTTQNFSPKKVSIRFSNRACVCLTKRRTIAHLCRLSALRWRIG